MTEAPVADPTQPLIRSGVAGREPVLMTGMAAAQTFFAAGWRSDSILGEDMMNCRSEVM